MSPRSRSKPVSRLALLLAAAAVVYVLLFGASFLADPLGQAPVLDARENIAWAQKLREGALPEEPIYRALLYPLILSKFPASSLPTAATIFGLALHLGSAYLVGRIAKHLWKLRSAAWLAGLVFAVYPVALYFAGQVLDITLSTTLFLGGVYALLRSTRRKQGRTAVRKRLTLALLAGILGGLAVLARPNFLPAVLCFPLIPIIGRAVVGRASSERVPNSTYFLPVLCTALGIALMLAAQGCINLKLSGQFRLLPWQGAYNLFAANREGANGKYYMQHIAFDEVPAGSNTTRMESELLYRQAVGSDAPLAIDAMGDHWRAQLLESITDAPARWLGLMGRKVLYVFNNWEQYNNLSYAYHKARWPMLTWNPLGWGVLLLAAFAGLYIGYRHTNRSALYGIALIGLAYAAGLLLFFVSARFRLPLAPLLCIAAGGCAYWPQHTMNKRQHRILLAGLVGLALLSFGNWFLAKDRATFIQDELLLAKASSQVGDDRQALDLARAILARDPERPEAQRLEVTSLFNLWLVTRQPGYWLDLESSLQSVESSDAAVAFIQGVAYWRGLQPEQAIETWQRAINDYGAAAQSCLDALQTIGQIPTEPTRAPAIEQIRGLLDL